MNVSSAGGRIYTPYMAWCSRRLDGLLRLEHAPFNIHVVLMEPGIIPAEMASVMHRPMRERCKGSPYEANVLKLDQANEKRILFFVRLSRSLLRSWDRPVKVRTPSDGMWREPWPIFPCWRETGWAMAFWTIHCCYPWYEQERDIVDKTNKKWRKRGIASSARSRSMIVTFATTE